MDPRFRKYLCVFGGCVVSGLALIVLLNLLVDPLGAYPFVSLPALDPYRAQLATRAAKAEMAARGGFDTLLVGSSRLRAGISGDAPAFKNARVCNLGLGGTTLAETSEVMNFALRHNRIKRVLLGADFHLFSDSRAIDPTFEVSRFNPRLNRFDYHGRNLLGADMTDESRSMLRKYLRRESPPAARDGFVPKLLPKSAEQRTVMARQIRASLTSPGAEGGFRRSPQRLEVFRQMVRRCRIDNIELIVFVPPVHALQLETIRAAGVWEQFEGWKRDVVRILDEEKATESVPFWDFTGFTGPVAEAVPPGNDRTARMKWYLEISHFTPALGEKVVDRIMSKEISGGAEPFGVRLTPSNIEAHLARLRTDRTHYASANPTEIDWIQQIAAEAGKTRATEDGDF